MSWENDLGDALGHLVNSLVCRDRCDLVRILLLDKVKVRGPERDPRLQNRVFVLGELGQPFKNTFVSGWELLDVVDAASFWIDATGLKSAKADIFKLVK